MIYGLYHSAAGMLTNEYRQDVLANPRLLDTAPTKFDADRADEKFLLRLPGNLLAMFRARGRMRRARRDAVKVFEEVELPQFLPE